MKARIKERINRRKIYQRLAVTEKTTTLPDRKLLLAYLTVTLLLLPPFILSVIYAFGN